MAQLEIQGLYLVKNGKGHSSTGNRDQAHNAEAKGS